MTDRLSDGTIKHVKIIHVGDSQFTVDEQSAQNYHFVEPSYTAPTAVKCSGCAMVTLHSGLNVMAATTGIFSGPNVSRRMYLCTNCGKFSTR